MRQRQPDSSQLQQPRSLRVEDTPRNVDVRNGVTVEQNLAVLKVVQEGKQGNRRRDRGNPQHVALETARDWRRGHERSQKSEVRLQK
jgi:hypothetical protein